MYIHECNNFPFLRYFIYECDSFARFIRKCRYFVVKMAEAIGLLNALVLSMNGKFYVFFVLIIILFMYITSSEY